MLGVVFASSYFDVDCFTVVVADANAKSRLLHPVRRPSGRDLQQTYARPIDQWRRCRWPVEFAMLGLAAKLLDITALMFNCSIFPMPLFRKTVLLPSPHS